jgi:choline-sulfatase
MTNLLFCYIDDAFMWWKLRNEFGVTIQTPNLDAFFAQATKFDNARAWTPVCGPSRTCTMTGWGPFQSGVHANQQEWFDYIPIRDNLLAKLKSSGYYVGHVGKIMHGYGRPVKKYMPLMATEAAENMLFTPTGDPNGVDVIEYYPSSFRLIGDIGNDELFYDDQVAVWTVNKINELPAGEPWAIFTGSQHPHTGYRAPNRFYELYNPDDITPPAEWGTGDNPRATQFAMDFMSDGTIWPSRDMEQWQQHVRGYLAALSHYDYQFGRMMTALENSVHADDTAVVLLSDHGYHVGSHEVWGKFTIWEEATRTPLGIRMPAQTTSHEVTTPVTLMDVYPTVLDILGLDIPNRLQGQSLLPLIPGEAGTYENRGALTSVYGTVGIVFGDYTYVHYPNNESELYNYVTDPSETENLSPTQPERVASMKAQMVLESARYGLFMVDSTLPPVKEARTFALQAQDAVVTGGAANDRFFTTTTVGGQINDLGGVDTIYLAHWDVGDVYTIPDGIEDLVISVKRAPVGANIVGNDLDNNITAPQKRFNVQAGGGDDFIQGPVGGTSTLEGEAGRDHIVGSNARTFIFGGTGADLIQGGYGPVASGGEGDDTITWARNAGVVHGDGGNDTITGNSSGDIIYGGGGNDTLDGGNGDDTLYGGAGADVLYGDGNDDTLHLGSGDVAYGGAGVDSFITGARGSMQIADWAIGETIDIAAWGVAPSYTQIDTNQVLVFARGRSVLVLSPQQITTADVQASVITA